MTPKNCRRAWEAEAVDDARLAGDLRDGFVKHAATCRDCSAERLALASIRRAAAALPEPVASPLRRRRLRAEILRQANDDLVVVARSWSLRRPPPLLAAAALVVALLFFFIGGSLMRRSTPPVAGGSEAARFEVAVVADASWRSEREGPVTRVVLARGAVAVHVDPLKPGERFVLTLPDGELEVHGTRFVVDVDPSGTREVVVTEGIVSLRLRGAPEVRLMGGDRWARDDHPARAPDAPPRPTLAPSSETRPPPGPSAVSSSRPSPPLGAGAGAGSGAAASDFVAGTKAFAAGAYGEADERLGSFLARHPGDPRAEDAAFMRAVARARMGDSAGAAARARAYLRAYPNGLRRQEAEAIARGR